MEVKLSESVWKGCLKKTTIVSKVYRQKRLEFARQHKSCPLQNLRNVLWSDETKINRVGSDRKTCVWRPKCTAVNPKHTVFTLKHVGGSIMLWGCMSWYGVGPIIRIRETS